MSAPTGTLPNELEYLRRVAKDARILEIGTCAGASALAFIEGGAKLVVTVDSYNSKVMTEALPTNFQDTEVSIATTFERLREHNNIIIIAGTSPHVLEMLCDNFFDIVFIDGDHSYEGVKSDYWGAFPKCRSDGLIILHDYSLNGSPDFRVKQFIDTEILGKSAVGLGATDALIIGSLAVLRKI